MTEFPKIELEDVADILCLSAEELNKVPYDEKFWLCGVGNCAHWSRVRDYGLHPIYYWSRHGWINVLKEFMYCGSCNKRYKIMLCKDMSTLPVRIYNMMPVTKEELDHVMKEKVIAA